MSADAVTPVIAAMTMSLDGFVGVEEGARTSLRFRIVGSGQATA